MTVSKPNIQARIVLCVLHDTPYAIRALCSNFPGYEYDDEYSGQGHDERMLNAFEASDNTVHPTLGEDDRQAIARHCNVALLRIASPFRRNCAKRLLRH